MIVTEYLPGGSLADLFKKAEWYFPSMRRAVVMALDCSKGMTYLHGHKCAPSHPPRPSPPPSHARRPGSQDLSGQLLCTPCSGSMPVYFRRREEKTRKRVLCL